VTVAEPAPEILIFTGRALAFESDLAALRISLDAAMPDLTARLLAVLGVVTAWVAVHKARNTLQTKRRMGAVQENEPYYRGSVVLKIFYEDTFAIEGKCTL
jgi:hypothetical protein